MFNGMTETWISRSLPYVTCSYRLSSVYDVTGFAQKHINPNLRGMGHPGWGDNGNPTHCIRFASTETGVTMTYKKCESDGEWLPKASFDEHARAWVPKPGLSYTLMSGQDTESLLSSAPTEVVEVSVDFKLQSSVFNCSHSFEGRV